MSRSKLTIFSCVWLGLAIVISFSGCFSKKDKTVVESENGSSIYLDTPSQKCKECHEDVFEGWSNSHHYHANDLYKDEEWSEAFASYRIHTKDNQVSEFMHQDGQPSIKTIGPDGTTDTYHPEMTLAYHPMIQFLIPFTNGRWQVTELAWDTHEKEWFSVYDREDIVRNPEEWGHWTQRGMNWNAQCGICHTSHYSKNYDIDTDSYQSTWKEMGISCLQCHGEMPAHMADPEAPIADAEQVSMEAYYESCYSCHSRREDITGNFRIGDKFVDHCRIQLPTMERYYFPDGQIKDEVFVYGSFLQSNMYHNNVRCMDCHDPHSLELKLPIENNEMCMLCHTDPGVDGAIPIDPTAHSFHQEGSEGNRCVECHMAERTYMARDPRRDHGFHTPDPFLAKELGVPNACADCHEEEGEQWMLDAYEKWYGESDKRKAARKQARLTQKGYDGDVDSIDAILDLMDETEEAIWRGAYAQMVLSMALDQRVVDRVLPLLKDESPIVRSAVVQSLSNYPGFEDQMRPMLEDEARLVRVDASWYLRNELDVESNQWKELMDYMKYTADQPGGALRWTEFHAAKGDVDEAEAWMNKVVSWDSTSIDAWQAKGFLLNRLGKPMKAIKAFEEAHERNTENFVPVYYQALIYAEQGRSEDALKAFQRVVFGDASMDRAWYNLGLLYNERGNIEAALSHLDQAMGANPEVPDYPYAKATILLRNQQFPELLELMDDLLERFPTYAPALQLKQQLDRQIIDPKKYLEQNQE